MLGFIKDIAGPLIGGLFGFGGQASANAANARMARDQMAFQERMRSTQWQTAVEDIKKAGLNPSLAYGQGGAGTPTGASSVQQNTGTAAIEGATSAFGAVQQLRRNAAEIDLIHAQAEKARNEAQVSGKENIWLNLRNEIGHRTFDEALRRIRAETAESESSAKEAKASARITELGIPEAEAIAAFYRSAVGKLSPYITSGGAALRGISTLFPLLSRGRSVRR